MSILLHENDFWKNLNNNFAVPLILVDGRACLYYLVSNIHEDLERFITTGMTETKVFNVLPKEREDFLISHWAQLGFIITYHDQRMTYMHKNVSITYLKVKNPKTGVIISLLPWFLLPDRPYPIFIYIFAIWHYQIEGNKSLSQTAAATGKLFGIKEFHKSTVSRSIKALENIIDISRINSPLSVEQPELPTYEDLNKLVQEILSSAASIESLEENYREMIKPLPKPVNRTESATRALSGIPIEYSKIIKDKEVIERNPRDTRKRPPRPRCEEAECVQRPPRFVDFERLEQTRKDFIETCRCIVLDAAISYHRFLV